MYGLTRGTMTLLGAGVAGLLLWIASQTDADGLGGYWTYVGLLAGAGLVMALSQLLGGWTKWGWPRVTATVFLLGFLPALVVGGLVLLHAQPEEALGQGWAADVGAAGLAEDLAAVLPALAFGLGLLFGVTFDTTGPRRVVERTDEVADEDVRRRGYAGPVPPYARSADEPVAAEREYTTRRDRDAVGERDEAVTTVDGDRERVDDGERVAAGGRVDRDGDGVDDRDETPTVRRDDAERR